PCVGVSTAVAESAGRSAGTAACLVTVSKMWVSGTGPAQASISRAPSAFTWLSPTATSGTGPLALATELVVSRDGLIARTVSGLEPDAQPAREAQPRRTAVRTERRIGTRTQNKPKPRPFDTWT